MVQHTTEQWFLLQPPKSDTPKLSFCVYYPRIRASKGSNCICVQEQFTALHPWKTNMTMEQQAFDDVTPIQNGDFPASHVSFQGCASTTNVFMFNLMKSSLSRVKRFGVRLTLWQIEMARCDSHHTIPTKIHRHNAQHLLDELLHDFRWIMFFQSQKPPPPPQKKVENKMNSSTKKN